MLDPIQIPQWSSIDAVSIIGPAICDDRAAIIPTSAGDLKISFYSHAIRMQIGAHQNEYGMILPDRLDKLDISADETDSQIIINSRDWRLELTKDPFAFALYHQDKYIQSSPSDAHFVREFRLPPLAKTDEGWFLGLELKADEPVYGLGEKWSALNKNGQFLRSYNHDALGVNAEISYKNIPFAWSPSGWGIFVHTAYPVAHAVGFAPWSNRSYNLVIEDPCLDIFIMKGEGGASLIDAFSSMTGFAQMPPEWSAGVIMSRAYYKTADDILAVAKKIRDENMPCEVITFDGRAWQDTDTRFAFEWDSSRYPDPKAIIDQLKAMDFKICVWEYPLVSVKNALFDDMAEKGWLLKDKNGKPFIYQWDPEPFGKVLTQLPDSGIVDFTHPEAYAYWKGRHKELFDVGVDMIKADFGEQIPDDVRAYNGANGRELHNIYALLYNKCVSEAAQEYSKNGAFLFSRCGWTGSQRYPSLWGGDPQSDWGGLAASIRGGLSWGLTGGPFYATDVGGFYQDKRDSILYLRWLQAAVFSAHIRLHGIGEREPWSYDPEIYEPAMAALKLREELRPYIIDAYKQAVKTGMPVQRAMVLAFPNDRAAWAFEIQYMFGDDYLFAPCLNPEGTVDVYLPHGCQWRHIQTKELYEAGKVHRLNLALDQLAAFEKQS